MLVGNLTLNFLEYYVQYWIFPLSEQNPLYNIVSNGGSLRTDKYIENEKTKIIKKRTAVKIAVKYFLKIWYSIALRYDSVFLALQVLKCEI